MGTVGQKVGIKRIVLRDRHSQLVVCLYFAFGVIQGNMNNGIDIVQVFAQGLDPFGGIGFKNLAQGRIRTHGLFNQGNDLVRVHGVNIHLIIEQCFFQRGACNLAHQRHRLYLIVNPVVDHSTLRGVKGLDQTVLVHIHQSGRLAVPLDIAVVRDLAVNELVAQLQRVALLHRLMVGIALRVRILYRIAVFIKQLNVVHADHVARPGRKRRGQHGNHREHGQKDTEQALLAVHKLHRTILPLCRNDSTPCTARLAPVFRRTATTFIHNNYCNALSAVLPRKHAKLWHRLLWIIDKEK